MADLLFQILAFSIPGIIVFLVSYLTLRAFLRREQQLKMLELKAGGRREIIPLRLQAHERLALLLERIAFNNLIQRVRVSGMTVAELHGALLSNIRTEFEHNLSQQIYVSPQLWDAVSLAKDQTIQIINMAATKLPKDEACDHLSKVILTQLLESPEALPAQKAMDLVKAEARLLF